MNISSGKAGLSLVVEHGKPVRTGSLPFKKRRFPRLALSVLSEGNEAEDCESELVPRGIHAPNAEKIAALALVAAAASQNDSRSASETSSEGYSTESDKGEPTKHGFSFYNDSNSNSTRSSANSTTLNSALVAAAADLQSLHDSTVVADFDASSCKKINRAPLTSPLPNGCHGRTSRNNSYCRRQPYNGSHFCKSHYQSLVLSGVVTEEELKNGKIVEAGEMPDAFLGGSDGLKAAICVPTVHHQDKRYTGADNEIRCKATTTRGRDCSYCAVNGTKYCHLHATFDTNPPPRRGGASFAANAAKSREASAASGSETTKSNQSSGNAKSGKPAKADAPKRRGSSISARRLSTTKNLEKHMAHAPYPLLSTLATDKWLNRKVIVSTGPLTNHVGHVEKWGNGWISVRLPGVGLHNRRSFELYLHPSPDHDGDTGSTTTSSEKRASCVEVFDGTKERTRVPRKDRGRDSLPDTTAPPTPRMSDKPVMSTDTVHEVTPLISCRVIGIDQNLGKEKGGSKRVSSIMFPTCFGSSGPNTVPESPVPERPDKDLVGSETDKEGTMLDVESKLQLPVRPRAEGERDDIPLVQSLLLASDKRSGKSKLGLLFGTAALERSRRNIHKPKRYEDTELIAKKLKKREREGSVEGAAKRHCATPSSVTESSSAKQVISSSDEESSNPQAGMVSV